MRYARGILYVIYFLIYLPVVILGMMILFVCMLWRIFPDAQENRLFRQEYQEFLLSIEGKSFFCYNNNTRSQLFIEAIVLPVLSPEVNVIFLNGKTPESDFSRRFISQMLYGINDRTGFPYLLKVVNGEVLDQSANNELFNTFNQNKAPDQLLHKINAFYQSPEHKAISS
ncbi:hypothetical protein SAMN05421820_103416 [Pedobacter steynii]|uniref:Uncharacterized protein n=1 Tax=Pedobacter steynii TaxID=430522 RepID=A0A1G9S044_9SPHI|nr:hypothetical protein [Pedobacter steynii]NQX37593.1 hypothetical protein [Pedobacter steynii]SDM28630.1 hypothetical protein SAMN05421820_103416 [Pedobacter steynii]